MSKIRAALAAVAEKLGLNKPLLARAQNRYSANRKRAYKYWKQAGAKQKNADRLRALGGYPATSAPFVAQEATNLAHAAYKNHLRAQYWLGKVKGLTQTLEGLETSQKALEAEVKRLNKVTIIGDDARGGTKPQRLKAVALASAAACASGRRPNFYSQVGEFDAKHCITGPRYGHRDDCSSWFASVYYSAGLNDPSAQNFTAGWTGTLVEHGKQVANPEPGDAVIYGSGSGHHVEMYVGPGNKTIGHGSSPVDAGVIDLFGDGDYRFFRYI